MGRHETAEGAPDGQGYTQQRRDRAGQPLIIAQQGEGSSEAVDKPTEESELGIGEQRGAIAHGSNATMDRVRAFVRGCQRSVLMTWSIERVNWRTSSGSTAGNTETRI